MAQDFSQRISIVVRKDLEPWQITNTVAHIAGRLGYDIKEYLTGDLFMTKDGVVLPRNSQYPIIVFQTQGVDQLRAFLTGVRAAGLPHLAYVREMIDFTDDSELQAALSVKTEAEVEYLGVGIFGPNETVKKLTKGFSLWK